MLTTHIQTTRESKDIFCPTDPQSPRAKNTGPKGTYDLFSRLSSSGSDISISRLTAEQLSKTFDEWLKIAVDNKINTKNTWDLALIDYFGELSLFQDGESINFQKASCTLDGCVKIYSSRVDSVADETGRLVHGLLDGQQDSEPVKRPNRMRPETLARNLDGLNVKRLEMELCVNPLLHNIFMDFDEGGSSSLLLAKQPIQENGAIVLDSDSAINLELEPAQVVGIGMEPCGNKDVCPTFKFFDLKTQSFRAKDQVSVIVDRLSQLWLPDDQIYFDGQQAFFDPNESGTEQEPETLQPQLELNPGLCSYFDQTHRKTWAGPEHWKVARNPAVRPSSKREPVFFDFLNAEQVNIRSLFEPANSNAISRDRSSRIVNRLPENVGYTSEQVLRLFTRPNQRLSFGHSASHVHEQTMEAEEEYPGPFENAGDLELDNSSFSSHKMPCHIDIQRLKSSLLAQISESPGELYLGQMIPHVSKYYPGIVASLPQCFVSLLHLANENNLTLKSVQGDILVERSSQ